MDSTLACLAAWMPRQRWYAAKGRTPSLRLTAVWDYPTPEAGVRVRTLLVRDEGALPPVLYQVPLVSRPTADVGAGETHVVGSPEPGTTLIDGPHDSAFTAALLLLATRGGHIDGAQSAVTGVSTNHLSNAELGALWTSEVLKGEQSNTSIIYKSGGETSPPIIAKVFRQLHPGVNPDIELQTALAEAGSSSVPKSIGSISAQWPDPSSAHGAVSGSIVFAQEFFPGTEDAWRIALRAAASGKGFAAEAGALGEATATVHAGLAQLFPTVIVNKATQDAVVGSWLARLRTAIAEVPELAVFESAIEARYRAAQAVAWPDLQRIHGDYHLGQVIFEPSKGWILLDFEGEPLRVMSERRQPDLALRDVAGMLRSFDYVAGSIRLDQPHHSADEIRAWAGSARRAFLDGYSASINLDRESIQPLLAALEIDKAVYEAIYEARNRPTWLAIPRQAIERLTG